jgi:hypothetical protein
MNFKPILMIHNITEDIFLLPLENYILTFDDGLLNHYIYCDNFKKINTEKIYFIPTGTTELTIEQIKYISSDPLTTIGGHSHLHKSLTLFETLDLKIKHIKHDTELMIDWFRQNLNEVPNKFCYPFNDDCNGIYTVIIKNYGFNSLYGRERIPVETLLHN